MVKGQVFDVQVQEPFEQEVVLEPLAELRLTTPDASRAVSSALSSCSAPRAPLLQHGRTFLGKDTHDELVLLIPT